jgi:glycosyltransferase involved in cell wall biosynthesis
LLADGLRTGAGEGRFVKGLLHALASTPSALDRIERLYVVATANESLSFMEPVPSKVTLVTRRFPTRLRHTRLASWMGRTFPCADVAHGPVSYVFPFQARRALITLNDLSFLNKAFHVESGRAYRNQTLPIVLANCDVVVCISDTVLEEVCRVWPDDCHKCVRIYNGVAPILKHGASVGTLDRPRPYILAVGTIEPRKNYDRLIDAYAAWLEQDGERTPDLVIVGRQGWLCDATIIRLNSLRQTGKVRWLSNASDDQLAECYRQASVFTYLSVYEGFGYPPFEAAFACIPMVLSNMSAVGEIWQGHARCVDPADIREILAGWRWAYGLGPAERQNVLDGQIAHARRFSWERCVNAYLDVYERLSAATKQ